MSEREFKQLDTFAETVYLVRLPQDPKSFRREDGTGDDVVLTFADNSRIPSTETLWVDARVRKHQSERAAKFSKGDIVQVRGKLRFKKGLDGNLRGKIYDADISSFTNTTDRAPAMLPTRDADMGADETPAFTTSFE